MKKSIKIGIMILSISTLPSFFAFAQDNPDDGDGGGWLWKSKSVKCTATRSITIGGGPVPLAITKAESWEGSKRTCVDGWSLCISGSCK